MAIKNKYQIERNYINNPYARSKEPIKKVLFLVAHETANDSADADAHQRYFDNIDFYASAHTFIDDGKILEIIPLDEKAWHVNYGKPTDNRLFGDDANDAAIGSELCRTGNFDKAYDRYVWYHAYLCHKFNLNPQKDIVAHSKLDPERRSDPQSWLEPNGVLWEDFINDVQNYYDNWDKNSFDRDEKVKSVKVENVSSSDKGKRVESIYKGDEGLDFYSSPSWNDKYKVGTFAYGMGWTIRKKLKVDGAYMYEVENSNGDVYYITAAEKYVRVEGQAKPSKPKPKKAWYIGKRAESKVPSLRFYSKPSWDDRHVAGILKEGYGFPDILDKVKVDGYYQYKVRNSKGAIYYVTASDKYIRVE